MTAPIGNIKDNDEIDLAALYKRLERFGLSIRRSWRLMVLPLCIAVGSGVFLSFGATPEFSASTRLIPYSSMGGVGGGELSGLAGLAGIRLPAGGVGQAVITADLYPDLVATFDFRSAVANTPIAFSDRDSLLTATAFFTDVHKLGLVDLVLRYTLGLPGVISANLRPKTLPDKSKAVVGKPQHFDADFERTVRGIGERIVVAVDRKSGIITIKATMPDPVAAADLVRATSEHLTQTAIAYEVRKADEHLRFVAEQFADSKQRYTVAQRTLAEFADRNRMLVSAAAQIERERLAREVQNTFELYQQFSREREQARIKRNQDTPVFAVLERPVVPNQRSSPNRKKILSICLFVGLVGGVGRIARLTLVSGLPSNKAHP
jgi:uncharacterized protein involved in exopolysaccharide biosynthesis